MLHNQLVSTHGNKLSTAQSHCRDESRVVILNMSIKTDAALILDVIVLSIIKLEVEGCSEVGHGKKIDNANSRVGVLNNIVEIISG